MHGSYTRWMINNAITPEVEAALRRAWRKQNGAADAPTPGRKKAPKTGAHLTKRRPVR